MREIGRLVLVLGLIGVVSAASLAWVRASLGPRIEQQSDLYVRGPALERLFQQPARSLLANKVTVEAAGARYPVFFRRHDGRVTGLAVEAPGHGGYAGDVVLMIGLDLVSDQMLGVEIIQHGETPGVGARIENASFRKQWRGLPLDAAVTLRSNGGRVDGISGATFSSRAMIDGTNQIVALMREHREAILTRIGGS